LVGLQWDQIDFVHDSRSPGQEWRSIDPSIHYLGNSELRALSRRWQPNPRSGCPTGREIGRLTAAAATADARSVECLGLLNRYPDIRWESDYACGIRRTVVLALIGGVSIMLSVATSIPTVADDKELASALRAGGLVIVVRHGATFADQADTDPLHFDNIAAQRNLNDKGKALAAAFGDALRQIGVPVGNVYTSKFNRAYETAVLAGFKDIEKTISTSVTLVHNLRNPHRRTESEVCYLKPSSSRPHSEMSTPLASSTRLACLARISSRSSVQPACSRVPARIPHFSQ
jgi:hypothetical protein